MSTASDQSELILYQPDDGITRIHVRLVEGSVWLTQCQLARSAATAVTGLLRLSCPLMPRERTQRYGRERAASLRLNDTCEDIMRTLRDPVSLSALSVAVVVTISLAACSKTNPGSAAGDCSGVVDRVVDNWVRKSMITGVTEATGAITPQLKAELDRMESEFGRMSKPAKVALAKACTDDKWSADALACLRAAKTADAVDACNHKLNAEQRDHAEKVITEAMASAAPKGDKACERYADLEIKCNDAGEDARPVILDFCAKARAGAREVTYQLIKLESTCAETTSDCDAYKECIEKKKQAITPE